MKAANTLGYIEFGAQSNFSFLQGASTPEELVLTAAGLGYRAIGLADRNTVAGVVRGWNQSKCVGTQSDGEAIVFPYHPGARLVFCDGTPDVLAYPRDRQGWGHLCRLLTQANFRDESPKSAPLLYRSDLFEWGDAMSLAILPDLESSLEGTLDLLKQLSRRFGNAIRLAVASTYSGNDHLRMERAATLAKMTGTRLMATNNVLYHAKDRRPLQDVVTAIRLKKTVGECGFDLNANAERHMKMPAEIARSFRVYPEAIHETIRFASELKFSLKELSHNLPDEKTRDGATPQEELERLTWEGAAFRWPDGLDSVNRATLEKELALVKKLEYAGYFLIVYDIVRYARDELKILCQGRGSAANSLICYCLRITDIGPDRMNTLFERFISEERGEPPDIDVDFEHERRPEVLEYIYKKYSDKHTSLAAAVISYRSRSALREVAKTMGLSADISRALSGSIWGWWTPSVGEKQAKAGGLDPKDPCSRHLIDRANEIIGFPRHLTQHVGGFVITKDRLDEIVPIMKTAMHDRKMIEWDKDDLDSVGLFKVDILALGMLSCLRRCFGLLKAHYPAETANSIATIPEGLDEVYDMICRADTLGVFQIESRAQMSMLPRLRPREFYDLVIEVAIVRPGPIQGNMVHPYLRRRMGKEEITYIKPELEGILGRTKGVPLFQEQAMRIAIECAKFEPGKADKLRRAMATFRRTGTIHKLRDEFIKGMVDNDYPLEFAERCFAQIEGFGEYGFPESHAASFALLVYASCWFKAFYPDVFCAAILNAQPMGFYAPAQLVRDARDHGVEIRDIDINFSIWDCTLEAAEFDAARILKKHVEMQSVIKTRHAVRLGFRQIKGLSGKSIDALVERRGSGYETVRDVWLRSGLDVDDIERLAQADAFRSIGLDRRAALWQVRALDRKTAAEDLPLFGQRHVKLEDNEPITYLPKMPAGEHVIHDYRAMGLSLKAHPLSFLRRRLVALGVMRNENLPAIKNGARVNVCGLVLVRQRPGKGNAIFLTLEDEGGIANIIVWKRDFERLLPTIVGSKMVRVSGRLQCESGVIHIVAQEMQDLTNWLTDLSEKAETIDPYGPTDEVKRGIDMDRRTQQKNRTRVQAEEVAGVMPKGRNFH